MKLRKIVFMVLGVFLVVASALPAFAGAFDWMEEFSIQAKSDPSGFRASLATRFKIGDAEISAVLGNVTDPADAYMVFRLGEISSKPPQYVLEKYKAGKSKGWGALAQSLGIKPGSQDFKALKAGGDLKGFEAKNKAAKNGKGKAQSKGEKGKGNKGK